MTNTFQTYCPHCSRTNPSPISLGNKPPSFSEFIQCGSCRKYFKIDELIPDGPRVLCRAVPVSFRAIRK